MLHTNDMTVVDSLPSPTAKSDGFSHHLPLCA